MPEFLGITYNLPVEVLNQEDTREIETQSLAIYRPSSGAQRWELKINLGPLNYLDPSITKISTHQNKHGYRLPFSLEMPQLIGAEYKQPRGTIIETHGVHQSGVDLINITANRNIEIPEGRFFKFANHNKVYQLLEQVSLQANIVKRISIYPTLLKEVQDNIDLFFTPNIRLYYHRNSPLSILHRATGRVEKILNLQEDIK